MNEWLVYLAHPDLDREPDLRSRIFCVLVSALLDAGSDAGSRIASLRHIVQAEASRPGAKLVEMLAFALEAIGDLMSVFTNDELVAIQIRRDGMVHGKLTHRRSDQKAWQIEAGRIVRAKYPVKQYYDGSIAIYRKYGNPGQFLTAMRDRLTHYDTLLWSIGHAFNMSAFVEYASREVEENRTDLLRIDWGTSSYAEAKRLYANRPELFRSLASYREEWRSQPATLDPVFERYYGL
ncbi:hypothetical protein [Brevundimonas sp.]|uniref:hypothetical protein n=1 Tax=Brevundimonas sp. TaxID=1871086 RepID=UPI003918A123